MEISSEEKIHLDAQYLSSEILFKRLIERSAAEYVFKTMEDYIKNISGCPIVGNGRT